MSKKETFYKDLKQKLEDNTKFPSEYLYKFIVPTTKNQAKEIEDVFKYKKAKISKRNSKTGKYISVSVLLVESSADNIIENYIAVEKIEGLISL